MTEEKNAYRIKILKNGPYLVTGNVPIESADGSVYEIRNRLALCRCGESDIKPFCDARHVAARFTEITEQDPLSEGIKHG